MKQQKKKTILFLLTFWLCGGTAFGQGGYDPSIQPQVDSLEKIINDPKNHDTTKIKARYAFAEITWLFRTTYWDSLIIDAHKAA